MKNNNTLIFRLAMWGSLVLLGLCITFLFAQVPVRMTGSLVPVIPFPGLWINAGVVIIGICSCIAIWYLGLKDGGPGLLDRTITPADPEPVSGLWQALFKAPVHPTGELMPRKELAGQGNHYLRLWIVYCILLLSILIIVWNQREELKSIGEWIIPGIILAGLPLIWFEMQYQKAA